MPNHLSSKDNYAEAVCLFLSELLRTRKVGIKRAADIAQKVVDHINLLDSEEDFLKFVKDLAGDFQELFQLQKRVYMSMESTKRDEMEEKVREFVIANLNQDPKTTLEILQFTTSDQARIEQICANFPQFNNYLNHGII